MNMGFLARDIAWSRLHHRGCLIARDYNLIADLNDISSAKLEDAKPSFDARRAEILSSYGYCDPPTLEKPFAYANGVAIIPIHGLLINRLSWSYSFATGYNFIRAQRAAAIADPDVQLIVYDINSPGGVASGCAELAREMFDTRGEKPNLAVVDARCYSAALFLGSAASRLVVVPSGGVGSIGCLSVHIDYSGMLDAEGLKVTIIDAPEGGEKADGHPLQPLSATARASIQRDVDYHYGLFTEAVARHRNLSEDEVIATKAACLLPPEALEIGLIDAIATPTDAVAEFFNKLATDADAGDDEMTTKSENTTAAQPATMSAADVSAAVKQALADDRARQSGIRMCEEAKGRKTLADHLASNTEMSVDEARAILAASPKEPEQQNQQQPSGFSVAMDNTPNPNVSSDANGSAASGGGDDDTPDARAQRMLGAYRKASGEVIELKPVKVA